MVGQYSVRGGIIDVYPPESPYPLRIELLGDQVESIRQFDPDTQKSVQRVDEAIFLPLSDYPTSPELIVQFDAEEEESAGQPAILPAGWEFHPTAAAQRKSSLFELLPRAVVVWDERSNLNAHYERITDRIASSAKAARGALDASAYYQTFEELDQTAQKHSQVFLDQLGMAEGAEYLDIPTQPTPRFQGNIPHCMREVQAQVSAGARALFTGLTLGDVERLADILTEYNISFQLALKDPAKAVTPYLQEKAYVAGPVAGTIVAKAAVRQGTAFPDSKVILYGAEDLFGSSDIVARQRKERSAASTFLTDLQDLKPGDLVVHVEHGIGRYQGTQQIAQGGRSEDFMLIEYAEQAKLYLPLTRLDLLQKYHGAGGRQPALDRMGGQTWSKTKSRIKAKLVDMADELLKLYAQRKLATGFTFSSDSNWQREFEDSFEYAETKDQLTRSCPTACPPRSGYRARRGAPRA
jgi:transcription-repair coupling factor (superfamily II helicase)